MTIKRKAIGATLFFIGGIVVASFIVIDWRLPVALFLILIVVWLATRSFLVLWVCCGLVGLLRFLAVSTPLTPINQLPASFEATIISRLATVRQQRLVVTTDFGLTGQVLVTADRYPTYIVGDSLQLVCRLEKPEPFDDFAYDKYLAMQGIDWVCRWPQIVRLEHRSGFLAVIANLKQGVSQRLHKALPEPESTLARALLLSERQELPDKLNRSFSSSGLTHIIAISGLHIVIFIFLIRETMLLCGASRRLALVILTIVLAGYLIMVGLPASGVRSAAASLIVLLGLEVGRRVDALYILSLLAAATAAWSPLAVRYDLGWQLSFLAVAGMIIWGPLVSSGLARLPLWPSVRLMLVATFSAQVFTWPLIAYHFNILSWSAPLANLVVLPVLPLLFALIILLGLGAGVWPLVGLLIRGLSFSLLHWMIRAGQWLSGAWSLDFFSATWLISSWMFTAIATGVIIWYENNNRHHSNN